MPRKLKNPKNTGETTGVPAADGSGTVQRKVYTVEQVKTLSINTEILKAEKADLESRIEDIDELLLQIED